MTKKKRGAAKDSGGPFRHVVWLMLENRSLDHVIGGLQAEIPRLDGVDPANPRWNEFGGARYSQLPGAGGQVQPDPGHDTPDVLHQLENGNAKFVANYARIHPETGQAERQQVMSFHTAATMPTTWELGRTFAICDRWFSSVPGPTWTNRLFAMSGTSLGRVKMPKGVFHPNLHKYDQPSVFQRLTELKIPFRIYYGDFPLALLLSDRRKMAAGKYFSNLDRFEKDASGAESSFPRFTFIEPHYLGADADDDHPPHDVAKGQRLVARIYAAIRSNEALWSSTLLIVNYDEHGGFYDHVAPPPAMPPDAHHEEYDFGRLGVRVPTLLVSPWIDQQVVKTEFDHTSALRWMQLEWSLGTMGSRVSGANPMLDGVVIRSTPREGLPKTLPTPAAPKTRARPKQIPLNDHQKAIVSFSEYLDHKSGAAPKTIVRAQAKAMRSEGDAGEVAKERARRYLAGRGARL
jgi:phospholipase C